MILSDGIPYSKTFLKSQVADSGITQDPSRANIDGEWKHTACTEATLKSIFGFHYHGGQ